MEAIKARNIEKKSNWIVNRVGENLFQRAKDRLYTINDRNGSKKLALKHDVNPKERLVQQVLTEIQNRWNEKMERSQEGTEQSGTVLIMVKVQDYAEFHWRRVRFACDRATAIVRG